MIAIGLDIGSTATKGVLIDDHCWHQAMVPTGWSPREAGHNIIRKLKAASGVKKNHTIQVYVTGYGRVAFDGADKTITEIKCHARGITEINPEIRTIIDIGGQDSKVIRVDQSGRVIDFTMNDKCAAGTGRFLQVTAAALGMDVSELGQAEEPEEQTEINSMCTVFAESEIIGLLNRGCSRGGIIAGLHQSVGKRVAAMARRLGLEQQIAFTGGVARNPGVQRALEKELGCPVIVPEICQYTGALGAALLASQDNHKVN
jgi:predicted CoA-substrate-specific enzyme activase